MYRVLDVEHNPIARARARCQPNRRVHGDVVALVRVRRLLRAFLAVSAAIIQAIHRARSRIDKQARAGHHLRVLRRSHGNFDHFNAKQRRIRVLLRGFTGAPSQLFRLTNERCARHVDINVVFVVWIDNQSMRMRSAARLRRRDLLGILDVGNVENSHAAETLFLRCWNAAFFLFFLPGWWRRLRRKPFHTAIQTSIRHLHRHE